ncbi:MAG: pinensin family lanthipeptide [Bacteroidota bacterium]
MKKKLNLKDLQVKSFVTSLEGKQQDQVVGGANTLAVGCVSQIVYSACRTCGIICD